MFGDLKKEVDKDIELKELLGEVPEEEKKEEI
jgi:hypothetical protein